MEELECKGCGRFFIPGKGGEMIVEGCPNCGRPMRDQPNPIIGDEEMIWKEMPAAAADGGYDNDMSGNPLKEGILADGGWQNRKVRDETVGSTKETFSMDPYEPWWHQSAEEHTIDADAEIESVMPPTDSNSPTVEAKLNSIPGAGWHAPLSIMATRSLRDFPPAVLIDGEPFTPQMDQKLRKKYWGGPRNPNWEPKTFMLSHPNERYLAALKEAIETGQRFGPAWQQLDEGDHADRHAINDGEITLPSRDERGNFHDDHEALSRALYATQTHTFGHPYLSPNQKDLQEGIKHTTNNYSAGESIIPVSTSHPELAEILQRVADMNSLDPLAQWLNQHPELTKEQEEALQWMAEQEIIEKQGAPVLLNPNQMNQAVQQAFQMSLDPKLNPPGSFTPEDLDWLKQQGIDGNTFKAPPGSQFEKTIQNRPKVAPPKPSGGGLLDDIGKGIGNAAEDVVKAAPQVGEDIAKAAPSVGKGVLKAAPKALGLAGLPLSVLDENPVGFLGIDNPSGGPLADDGSDTISPSERKQLEDANPKQAPKEPSKTPENSVITPPKKTEPEKGDDGLPPIPPIAPVPNPGGKNKIQPPKAPEAKPAPKKVPTPAPGGGAAKQPPKKKPQPAQKTRPRPRLPKLKIPDLSPGPVNQNIGLPPMALLTHVEEIRNRMVKRAEREDAKEHPSSHGEIPANDITNPDEIDPKQKKDGDMSDWQKDYSVNDIGGARQDPGAVVVTVQSDRPEDFDIKEIADVLGVDENSESVKMITDFWDHFMDILDNPEDKEKQDDPILSLLGELLGNERGHGRKK